MEYETPHWAGSVDAVRKAFEVDAALPEFVHQQYQVPHASPEAIQLPHHQRIALIQRSQKLFKRWSVRYRPAHFFLKNLFTSCAFESLSLEIRILVIC